MDDLEECVLTIELNEHQAMSFADWHQLGSDIEEFLSTHPKYHTLEFTWEVEQA